MKKTYLVIGSNSFSGSHFVNYLLKLGHKVIGISRSKEPASLFLPYKWSKHSSFHFKQLDLNLHLKEIIELVSEERPHYIVNFAAQGMVAQSWKAPGDWFHTNTLSNVLLHDELRKCNFLEKYIHVSTPEVYGNLTGLVKENYNYNPSTPYAVSRAATDLSLMSFFKAYNFPVTFTRAANVYGPGQQLYRIIPRTILAVLLGKKLSLHGGGHSVRSFIHIEDVARATYLLSQKGQLGEVYHLATKDNISIKNLVILILRKMNANFDDHVEVVGERLGKDEAYLLDSEKIKSLGWTDTVSLEEGIEQIISWATENIDIIRNQPLEYQHKK